jgi:hypothetical protein
MGWDGKPIPYWLYKLHGLNLEFTCEICGNYSYWGRRAYERHFKEFRHQHGMRCLNVPNTKAFAEVRLFLLAIFLLAFSFGFSRVLAISDGVDGHTALGTDSREAHALGPRKPVT